MKHILTFLVLPGLLLILPALLAIGAATLVERDEPRVPQLVTLPTALELKTIVVNRKPGEPKKFRANAETVFVLDGQTVTQEVFFAAPNVTVTEVHTEPDGATLTKLVGETKMGK